MGSEERSAYRLEDGALGHVHFRAIERLYADQVRAVVTGILVYSFPFWDHMNSQVVAASSWSLQGVDLARGK